MRSLTYAGETVVTTDRVAASLVALTAALARRGLAEAVSIPVWSPEGVGRDAELVVGVGNDVLSVATDWPAPDPDTDAVVATLDSRLERIGGVAAAAPAAPHYDRVLDDPNFAQHDAGDNPPVRLRSRTRPRSDG